MVDQLNTLGIHFLQGGTDLPLACDPIELLQALAANHEARLRLALIPLLLQYPQWASYVPLAIAPLSPSAQLVLKCYYTAARLLQAQYHHRLEKFLGSLTPLPDLFSAELGLSATDGLTDLAHRQQILTGRYINWLGTYHHALQRWLIHGEVRRTWNS